MLGKFSLSLATHSIEKMQELLVRSILILGMMKTEAKHPVLGLDNLVTWVKERRPSN